jgi:hypothetical protein
MSKTRDRLITVFGEKAPSVFGDIARRYGFEMRREDDGSCMMESEACRVRVSLGTGHLAEVGVTLRPGKASRGFSSTEFGLGVVLDELNDPTVAFAGRPILSVGELDPELRRAAQLLADHCAPMLGGNFSIWPELERFSSERLEQFKKGGESRKTWIARQGAFVAFGQGDFQQAITRYESIADHLTPREKKKLEYARQQLQG